MIEQLNDPRKYKWIILSNTSQELRKMLADVQFNRHSNSFGVGETYSNSLGDIVTLVEGIAPGTYQVKCSIGCLSLLQDALGDFLPL